MSYHIKLPVFEGPLDLLLHLISKAKVNIEDIQITSITKQYMDYIDAMKSFDIEIASEFLVMASTLLHIKSCSLLPKIKNAHEEEMDPKEELIQRLIEYKKYKEASHVLHKKELISKKIFYKLPEEIIFRDKDTSDILYDLEGYDLLKAYIAVYLKEKKERKINIIHEIEKESITVSQRMNQIFNIIQQQKEVSFSTLLDNCYTRANIITTFLAILEMLKENKIRITQNKHFDDIFIRKRYN